MSEISKFKSMEEIDYAMEWKPAKKPFAFGPRFVIVREDFGDGTFRYCRVRRSCYNKKESTRFESEDHYASQAREVAEERGTTFVRMTCYFWTQPNENKLISYGFEFNSEGYDLLPDPPRHIRGRATTEKPLK